MQPNSAGSGGSSGGGELGRGGLARFHSTPSTWLEALLKEEEEEEDPLNTNECFTQLLSSNLSASPSSRNSFPFDSSADVSTLDASSSTGFLRQSSSPAEFFGNSVTGSEGYFSKYGFPSNYAVSRHIDAPSSSNTTSQKVENSANAPEVEMEKILEESVPCRVRAKRGFATHPRSIAERVRRSRISDRIRKLQELVPNMDKQTNTADMLDEAVAYVKFLQKQIEELSELQSRCTCMAPE
ncbi:hypothetical protein L6164_023719 [Bauhinia variegata]|uniref:Uncharacterized protein n=1 Tax=Bauhinia variegata TaxID=167791 RepID=A0ACB9ML76_BAUVA|nr:hypothetical protein L6164_023719 [Bauhinia variegata]